MKARRSLLRYRRPFSLAGAKEEIPEGQTARLA